VTELAPGRRVGLALLGALIGTYSTLCGIGGGVFAVPFLHYVMKMPLRTSVANSLVLVAASTTAATALELVHAETALRLDVVAALVAGSFVGTRIGFAIGKRVPTRGLKAVFAVLLVAVALQLLLGGGARSAFTQAEPGAALSVTDLAWIAVIGLVAGIVAPLLGIGGGLVAVPGVLFAYPALGFLVARACSMAMSATTAWQSVWLYRRDGEIRSHAALWLSGGALAGGAIGVQLVHVEAVTRSARGLVAFALLFAAARFAWDLKTRSAPSAPVRR
jgi:uncharacterized membrane protein YfcA